MSAEQELAVALGPVRAALAAAASADAAQILGQAAATVDRILHDARREAQRIRAQARAQGAADAAAALATERSRARREAQLTILAARREAYDALHGAARAAVARVRDEPEYPRLRAALLVAARQALGAAAVVREAPDGGVVGEAPGRRIDLSLAGFAGRAVDACAAALEET